MSVVRKGYLFNTVTGLDLTILSTSAFAPKYCLLPHHPEPFYSSATSEINIKLKFREPVDVIPKTNCINIFQSQVWALRPLPARREGRVRLDAITGEMRWLSRDLPACLFPLVALLKDTEVTLE